MILRELLNTRLLSRVILIKRSMIKKSNSDLGYQMKILNDNKDYKKTLELFDKYQKNNIQTFSSLIITQALKACANLKDLQYGLMINDLIPFEIKDDSYISASLIHLYMQCGDVIRAQTLFDMTKKKTLSMYGSMIKGYIKNNQSDKAIDLFKQIKEPNEIILNLVFNACAELKTKEALNLVTKLSKEMSKSIQSNPYLLTSLLDAFMKCGDVENAEFLFNRSRKKVLPMYGAMMKGYLENNDANKAIELFSEIRNPSDVNVIVLFNACARLRTEEALNFVIKVSKAIPKSYYSNARLLNSLLDALIKCGDCLTAETLFSTMKKSVENYGNLMNGFNKENNPYKTLSLFNQMKENNIQANIIIYLCLIKALSQIGDYYISKVMIKQIPKSLLLDKQIQNALIDMWSKSADVNQAKELFESIPQPDHIGYTAMINSYGLNGMGMQAIELYHQMPKEFIDEITYICVLNACSHSGLVDQARSIFKDIKIKTESIYCTMIDCLSRASFFEEAEKLIDEYECDHSPVLSMYMALLSGARNAINSYLSQNIYDRMKKFFPEMKDPITSATVLLANTYASSGEIEKASNIRLQLQKSGAKKKVGVSRTVVNGEFYEFRAHDRSHPRSNEIYDEIEKISKEILEHGYQYDSSWITRPLKSDETAASVLCGHSERLAIAWNFVANPDATRIQLTKNLRVCGDCHRATKLIAAIRQCEIIVRDANRIHHFYKNGQCSCNDYF